MDDITIGVTEFVNNILVSAQPNDQIIDIAVTETVETVLLDVSTTVQEVTVTATQNVIVENITVDYVNNENNIDINVTDATQDVTLNVTPTLVEINILRSGGEVNILQFNTLADFPATGSIDYFYLAKDTNKLYRWTGSAYAEISATGNARWGEIIGTLSSQTDLQNALNLKAPINSPTFTGTVSGITKGMVGLGAVDNTSDLDKPISTATQTALNNKQPLDGDLTSIAALSGTFGLLKKTANNSYTIDTNTYLTGITSSDVTTALGYTPENVANKGVNNGYASLGGDGKVPSSQLPSYVDDVIEVSSYGTLPTTGETGKIYITLDTNKIYRWTGSVYVEVSSSAAVWGGITGTLSNQTDLQTALDAKQDDLNGTGFVKASGTTISYDNTTYYPASNPNGYTSNVGTVTSVALTVPSAFSVSGSPITSSGTLAVTATGDTTQYIAGDGSLVTFPTIGTAGTLTREVRNTTGATLTKGTVVYISGATGNKPTVSKALATSDSTSAQTFGLVQANISNNANGNVVCVGDITGLDTSAFTEGAQLYLSSTTAGTYTTTKQLAPNHLVYIGVVTRAHPTQGQIEVNIQNGYELYELHDVSITSEANNQGLFYEASTDLWKNKSIATVLGYTPANGADYMALSGDQSIAGNKTFTGFAYFDNTIFLKQTTSISFISGYNSIAASSSGIRMGLSSGISALFNLTSLTTNRDYTLPNASGTIALTSDIPSSAGFVATTGNQTIAGDKTFSGAVINDGDLYLKQDATYIPKSGYTNLFASGKTVNINFGSTINAVLDFNPLSSDRTFSFPNTSGTIALTSDIPSLAGYVPTSRTITINGTTFDLSADRTYTISTSDATKLPLAGGTLTGALSGTTATLSGSGSKNALVVNQNSGFHALQVNQAGAGAGIGINQTGNTDGLLITHTGGRGIRINSANAGFGIIINNETASTSVPFVIQKSGANRITFTDAGAGTFVSTISAAGATLTGALSGTSATFSSTGFFGSDVFTYVNGGIFFNGSANYGSGIFQQSGGNLALQTNGTPRLVIGTTGAATFSSSVTANRYILNGTNGNSGQIIQQGDLLGTAATNFLIQSSTGNGIGFLVNGGSTFNMFINSSGNVGIGTTSPTGTYGKLSVAGGISILNDNNAKLEIGRYSSGASNSYIKLGANSNSLRITNNTDLADLFTITNAGNVGIGTTAPSTLLDLYKTSYPVIQIGSGTVTGNMGIDTGSNFLNVGTTTSHPLVFATANTERMRITSGGAINIKDGTLTGGGGFEFTSEAFFGARFQSNAYKFMAGNNTSEYMRITSGGNVLIGKTSDNGTRFQVSGNSYFDGSITSVQSNGLVRTSNADAAGMLHIRPNAGQNGYINFTENAVDDRWSIGISAGDSSFYFRRPYPTSSALASLSSGGVWSTTGGGTSDLRTKQDVDYYFDNGIESITKLQPTKFKFKNAPNKQRRGFIAQDVLKVIPDLVLGDGEKENGIYGLDYDGILAIAVKAIQELKAELDTLKNK